MSATGGVLPPAAAEPGSCRAGRVPQRVQRRRAKGWRLPPGTVAVGRPGPFGNPFAVEPVPGHVRTRLIPEETASLRTSGEPR